MSQGDPEICDRIIIEYNLLGMRLNAARVVFVDLAPC